MSTKVSPIHIIDCIPTGVVAKNLDTNREIFVRSKDVSKKVKNQITSLSEWRLHNGD